jgi:hypothetical protein
VKQTNNGPRRPIKPRLTQEGQDLTNIRLELGLRVSDVAGDLHINQGRVTEAEIGSKRVRREFHTILKTYYNSRKK